MNVAQGILYLVLFGLGIIAFLRTRGRTRSVAVESTQLYEVRNQWQAPAELISGPLPRAARLTADGSTRIKLMAVLLALIAVLAAAIAIRGFNDRRTREMLAATGITTDATIVQKWTGSRGGCRVYYSYPPSEKTYSRWANVSCGEFHELRIGTRVPARYAASDPATSRLDIETPEYPPFAALLYFAVFLAICAFPMVQVLWAKQLLASGQPVAGVVTQVAPARYSQSVSYRFLDSAGNERRGKTSLSAHIPDPGQTVTILYDPARPSRNTIYPPKLARLDHRGAHPSKRAA